MRIRFALFGAVLAAMALALSCATRPTAAPPESAPPAPAAEATSAQAATSDVPAPDALKAKATELRKKAFDLGLKEILADDYAAADKAYALGSEKYGKDNAASAAAYEDAAARFGKVIEDGLPLLASSERDKARAAEAAAFGKGAASYYYEDCDAASSALAEAEAIEKAGEYEKAVDAYRAVATRFAALGAMCDASAARDRIVERDFAKWDTSNWTIAEGKLASAGDLLGSDAKASLTAADEAILRYKLVMQNGLSYYMADRKGLSESERERAAGIKSEVAVKDDFEAAAALYASAEEKRAAEDFEAASELYSRSAQAFTAAYDRAKAKMNAARGELD